MKESLTAEQIPTIIQSHFPDYDPQSIKLTPLQGITNLIFKVQCGDKKSLIFKIFVANFDRKAQNQIVSELSKQRIAPKSFVMNERYRIQEFIHNAEHPIPESIASDPVILKLVLEKVYQLHQVKLPEEINRNLLLDKIFSSETKQRYLNAEWSLKGVKQEYETLKKEVISRFDQIKEWVFTKFKPQPHKIKFCHNDLINLNIFLLQPEETDQKKCILIDFEYAAYNYVAFDIANLLSETCFTFIKQNPGFKVDRQVSVEEIKIFCELYPGRYEGMERDVAILLVASNYYWGLVSLESHGGEGAFSDNLVKHGQARLKLVQFYQQQAEQCYQF